MLITYYYFITTYSIVNVHRVWFPNQPTINSKQKILCANYWLLVTRYWTKGTKKPPERRLEYTKN